jgi:hypothetical protein
MGKQELDNLVKIHRFKSEPPTHSEYAGMIESAQASHRCSERRPRPRHPVRPRLRRRPPAGARRATPRGYRSEDRVAVFQTPAHTVGTDPSHIQTFLKAHNERNLAEYQGRMEIDAKLLAALLRSTKHLEAEVGSLRRRPRSNVAARLKAIAASPCHRPLTTAAADHDT